jgi:F-box/leucine-rich repeat protein 2/20
MFRDGDALVRVDLRDDFCPDCIEALRARCAGLRSLRLYQRNRCMDITASEIASASPMLQTLRLDSKFDHPARWPTDAFGTQLGRWCPLLRYVDLSFSKVTDATLVAISRDCAELQSLNVSKTCVSDAGLKAIARGCPLLECINVNGTHVTEASLLVLAECCAQLRKVLVGLCKGSCDASITTLARRCPNLRVLDVESLRISDASLVALSRHCPHLEWIQMNDVELITTAGVVALAKGCPKLHTVNMSGCQGVGVEAVFALLAGGCKPWRLFANGARAAVDQYQRQRGVEP